MISGKSNKNAAYSKRDVKSLYPKGVSGKLSGGPDSATVPHQYSLKAK
jgi:hypothetical protein